MKINVAECAQALRVVNVFEAGNPSGIVTHPLLYDPNAPNKPQGYRGAPQPRPYKWWVRHVTAGRNSLNFLARGTVGGNWACIPYLIPTKASDQFADNWTAYKLIPDWARCYHIGDVEWHGLQEGDMVGACSGFEIENIGNFQTEIETRQYIKAALVYAYDCARYKLQDYNVLDHSTIAVPHTNQGGRRTDPQAGLFRESLWWDIIQQVREEWPWQSPSIWWGGRNE